MSGVHSPYDNSICFTMFDIKQVDYARLGQSRQVGRNDWLNVVCSHLVSCH